MYRAYGTRGKGVVLPHQRVKTRCYKMGRAYGSGQYTIADGYRCRSLQSRKQVYIGRFYNYFAQLTKYMDLLKLHKSKGTGLT